MKKYSTPLFVSIVLLIFIAVFPKITLAESQQSTCKTIQLRDGYYVGVAAGYDLYKMTDHQVYRDDSTGSSFDKTADVMLNGMAGDFIIGYGRFFGKNSRGYAGIELFANGSAADADFQTSVSAFPVIVDTDIVANGSFGLSLLPGIKLNNATMLYMKLGYNWTTLGIDETFRSSHDYEDTSTDFSDNVVANGFVYGIGLESAFDEWFSVRAEYTYSHYHSFSTDSEARMQPSRNQFILGLIYRMGIH